MILGSLLARTGSAFLGESRQSWAEHDKLSIFSIMEVITRDARCPMDRRIIGMGDLIEPPPPTEFTQAPIRTEGDLDEATDLRSGSSSKIDQLLHLLHLTPVNEKSLVFSQFTTFLDEVSPSA
jgi:SWI/SNF-related matrix-associated actin-dependent regulator of chromatin subfamily A3